MNLKELLNETKNLSITTTLNDLKEFAKYIIQQTKSDLEEAIIAQKSESYISTKTACEMLDVDSTTLWRWNKKKYLVPASIGGKNRYRMSDINKILQG